ncbi:MAG TPA: T9SS type A sorting domain-containing protein, partial [Chitinophagaceae bacterium]|nr:T9SS type A sorting domain-containing protein [Chitinophagaceae bacterium]
IDKAPLKGNNFYRLKITDKDGSVTYSTIVKLINNPVKFGVFPNPVNDDVILNIEEGKYFTEIIDQGGRLLISKSITVVGNTQVKIPVSKLAHGIYYLNVYDGNKNLIGYEKIIK